MTFFCNKYNEFNNCTRSIQLLQHTWIWNWIEDTYPDSIQIVDYFHAKEYLCEFAKEYFNNKNKLKSGLTNKAIL